MRGRCAIVVDIGSYYSLWWGVKTKVVEEDNHSAVQERERTNKPDMTELEARLTT